MFIRMLCNTWVNYNGLPMEICRNINKIIVYHVEDHEPFCMILFLMFQILNNLVPHKQNYVLTKFIQFSCM